VVATAVTEENKQMKKEKKKRKKKEKEKKKEKQKKYLQIITPTTKLNLTFEWEVSSFEQR
jgi:hypothetical protein